MPSTKDTMPALPTNDERTNGAAIVSVAARSWASSGVSSVPSSVVSVARNVLWAQCSLHVWASVSSSTSVGSRPTDSKWSRMTVSSAGSRARARSSPRRASASSSRPRTAIVRTPALESAPGCRSGSAVASVQCSMIGLATRRRSRTSASSAEVPAGSSMRRPVAAASTVRPSWAAARTTASAAPSVTPGCSVISTCGPSPGSGGSHDPVCSSGSARKAPSRSRPVVVEVALDEHQVSDPHVAAQGQAERVGTGCDGRCSGVVVAGPHRVAMDWPTPGRHCSDPTARASPARGC